jgi:hypothetical protein
MPLEVEVEHCEGHVVPESGVVLEGVRRFLKGAERLLKFSLLVEGLHILFFKKGLPIHSCRGSLGSFERKGLKYTRLGSPFRKVESSGRFGSSPKI